MKNHSFIVKIATLIAIIILIGCSNDEISEPTTTYGDLQISYRIGSGTNSCDDVNISFVRIYLMTSMTNSLDDEIYNCNPDNQSVIMVGVPVGAYTIRIEGLDSKNAIIYAGTATSTVNVVANQTNGPVTVVLDLLRPAIQIWFGFSEVGGCDRFEVDDFIVRLYENGSSMIFDETYPCADQLTTPLLIEDLSETSSYDVRIRGTNANGEYTFEFNADDVMVAPGAPTELSASMSQCSGICTEP